MSYAVFNPPPTGVPLSIVAVANENTAYASGGGGGGGGGPNLAVSTLSFPAGNQTTQGVINMSSILTLNDPTTPVGQDFVFQTNVAPDAPIAPYLSSFVNEVDINGMAGNAANGALKLFGSPDGSSAIWGANAGGQSSKLTILAQSVVMPTDLQVSSINGAAPGGGGVAPAGISTNQVAAATGTKLNLYGGSIATYITVDDAADIITLAANQVDAVNADLLISSINGQAPGGGAGNNPAFSTLYVSSFVSADSLVANTRLDAPAVGGAVSTAALRLEADNVGSHIVYISTGQNMTELKFAQTYIQVVGDLQVSSINGAVPGSVTNTSTGSLAQSFVLAPGGAPVTAITGAFNTTAGNLYSISWQDTVAANGTMAINSYIQYAISSSAGFLPLDVVQGVPISSFAISSLLNHNYLFKAEGATGQLTVSPNVMPSTLINLVPGQDIVVRDLGAVV